MRQVDGGWESVEAHLPRLAHKALSNFMLSGGSDTFQPLLQERVHIVTVDTHIRARLLDRDRQLGRLFNAQLGHDAY